MKKIKTTFLIIAASVIFIGCATNQTTNQNYNPPSEDEVYQTYTNRIIFPKPELE